MTSSYSSTVTSTYTVADVEKVMRNIKADLMMIAESTKAMTEEKAKDYAHDIELLVKNEFLDSVDVTLLSAAQTEIKASKYHFQTKDATSTQRPGGVQWPSTPTGWVRIVLHYSDNYKTNADKVSKLQLKIGWVKTSADTSHKSLTTSGGRGYSSNGFGANRNDYS